MFAIWIHIGIFSTNSIYYLRSPTVNQGVLFIRGTVFSLIFSTVWYVWGKIPPGNSDKIVSIFRSISENLAFTGIVFSTYVLYNTYLEYIPASLANPISLTVGTAIYAALAFLIEPSLYGWKDSFNNGNSNSTLQPSLKVFFLQKWWNKYRSHPAVYSVLYYLWWTSGVFSTNATSSLYLAHFTCFQSAIIGVVLGFIATTL